MPMRYADEAALLRRLRIESPSPEYTELVALENALCDTFDAKVGTSFGAAPVAETRTVGVINGAGADWLAVPVAWTSLAWPASPRLILDIPLRSLTAIETGGTWDGAAWVDGTTLTADQYRLTNTTAQGSYAIDLTGGTWGGVVRITGVWGDQSVTTVPADVAEALTFITGDEWLIRNSSPMNQVGPEGFGIGTRNAWTFATVTATIERHRVVEILV